MLDQGSDGDPPGEEVVIEALQALEPPVDIPSEAMADLDALSDVLLDAQDKREANERNADARVWFKGLQAIRKKKEVGHVTSGVWSPTAKRNIALAELRAPFEDGYARFRAAYPLIRQAQ